MKQLSYLYLSKYVRLRRSGLKKEPYILATMLCCVFYFKNIAEAETFVFNCMKRNIIPVKLLANGKNIDRLVESTNAMV